MCESEDSVKKFYIVKRSGFRTWEGSMSAAMMYTPGGFCVLQVSLDHEN